MDVFLLIHEHIHIYSLFLSIVETLTSILDMKEILGNRMI